MRLLVDIGNTRLKWVAVESGYIVKRGFLLHADVNPMDWGQRSWHQLRRPSDVIIANVAGPAAFTSISQWVMQHWGLQANFVRTKRQQFGVSNGYTDPDILGVDRWMAMLGCRQLQDCNSIIIDCGTAAKIDALRSDGQHMGGIILPGLQLMHEALSQKTSQIQPEDFGEVTFLGRQTRDCIAGGTVHAIAAVIDRAYDNMAATMQQTHPGSTTAIITGGNAETILPFLQHRYQHEPDLVLQGLKAIAYAYETL